MEQELTFIDMINRAIARRNYRPWSSPDPRVAHRPDPDLGYRFKLDRRPEMLEELRELGRTKVRWFLKERRMRITESPVTRAEHASH